MVEPSIEERLCKTCNKNIDIAKFRLHEVACARNNSKCAKCGQIVAKVDRDQHELDFHTAKKVVVPVEEIKQEQVAEIPKEVVKQLPQDIDEIQFQKCLYCPLEFTIGEFHDHMDFCGSKTKECPDCFSKVINRKLNQHKTSGECARSAAKIFEDQVAQE